MTKIVIYPSEVLRKKTEKIIDVNKELLSDIKKLTKILKNGENAAGLAAPQIGISKRFFGSKEISNGEVKIYLNPTIEKSYGVKIFPKIVNEEKKESDFLEGCLSFPNLFGTVKRWLKIDVSWDEVDANKLINKKASLTSFDAIVWQHEQDHLDGIVFIDHIKEDKGKLYKDINGKMIQQSLETIE